MVPESHQTCSCHTVLLWTSMQPIRFVQVTMKWSMKFFSHWFLNCRLFLLLLQQLSVLPSPKALICAVNVFVESHEIYFENCWYSVTQSYVDWSSCWQLLFADHWVRVKMWVFYGHSPFGNSDCQGAFTHNRRRFSILRVTNPVTRVFAIARNVQKTKIIIRGIKSLQRKFWEMYIALMQSIMSVSGTNFLIFAVFWWWLITLNMLKMRSFWVFELRYVTINKKNFWI